MVNVGIRLFVDEEEQRFAACSLIGLPQFIDLFRVGYSPKKGAKPPANVCPSSRTTRFLQQCQEMILLFSRGGLPRTSGPVSVLVLNWIDATAGVSGKRLRMEKPATARPQVPGAVRHCTKEKCCGTHEGPVLGSVTRRALEPDRPQRAEHVVIFVKGGELPHAEAASHPQNPG